MQQVGGGVESLSPFRAVKGGVLKTPPKKLNAKLSEPSFSVCVCGSICCFFVFDVCVCASVWGWGSYYVIERESMGRFKDVYCLLWTNSVFSVCIGITQHCHLPDLVQ